MTLLSISGFLGRFHPVLVHLPIGILLLGVLMHWLSRKEQFQNLRPAIGITLLLGALGAILSCISGWLLAEGGEYEGD
ncbi:MAG: c-type cytochrome domain-containing protein, partial [Agriterribacter sp.]